MLTTSSTLLSQLRRPHQPQAWERFVRLYTPPLLVWIGRQGFHGADAKDLVQEVMLKLIRQLPTYKRGAGQSFRGWLFRVAVNQCRDFRRRKATRPLPAAHGLSEVREDVGGLEHEEADYRRLLVRHALALIQSDFQEATWKAFTRLMIDERSAAEVAAELKLSVNPVYLARHRVLTRLRQELDGLLE